MEISFETKAIKLYFGLLSKQYQERKATVFGLILQDTLLYWLSPEPLAVGDPLNIPFWLIRYPVEFRSWLKNCRPTSGDDWFIITV